MSSFYPAIKPMAPAAAIPAVMIPTPDEVVPTPAPGTSLVVSGQLKQSINTLYRRMDLLPTITDQGSFDLMRDLVKDASNLRKHVEASRQIAKKPFLDIGRKIDEAARPFIENLDALITEGKHQETEFLIAEQKRNAEAEAARAAAEAEALKDTSRPTPPLVPVVLFTPTQAPLQSRSKVNIVNEALLPREYLVPFIQKINADALAGKVIPGVEVVMETSVVAR